MNNDRTDKAVVLQGTLILLVLRTLEALGPLHGYRIARRIEQISKDALQTQPGHSYPALLRMEQEGSISSKWETSEKNRRARFYSITAAGRNDSPRKPKIGGVCRQRLNVSLALTRDLPEPFGPRYPVISPARTEKLTPSTATMPENRLETW